MIEQALPVHFVLQLSLNGCSLKMNVVINVAAAVIERQGRILICQRRGGRHALKWEFPGGKIEPGEDASSALARELREELQIEATIGALLHTETVRYADGPAIHLQFFRVTDFSGEPVNLEFEQIVWEERRNLPAYDFLEGDIEFVEKLASAANQTSDSEYQ
jgi:8-oxo-dGTP diphosphatase